MTLTMENIAILGASRGLGFALCELACAENHRILMARDTQELKSLYGANHNVLSYDFTKEEKWDEIFNHFEANQVSRVFYCAGGGPFGLYHNKDWKDHIWAFKLNFLFPAFLVHKCLNSKFSFQQFIYVGSDICESSPDPGAASYCSSKHAMRGLIHSIQQESPNFDLRLFSPGYMDTSMLPPKSRPREQALSLLDPNSVAQELWQWAQSPYGDRHKILPSL